MWPAENHFNLVQSNRRTILRQRVYSNRNDDVDDQPVIVAKTEFYLNKNPQQRDRVNNLSVLRVPR